MLDTSDMAGGWNLGSQTMHEPPPTRPGSAPTRPGGPFAQRHASNVGRPMSPPMRHTQLPTRAHYITRQRDGCITLIQFEPWCFRSSLSIRGCNMCIGTIRPDYINEVHRSISSSPKWSSGGSTLPFRYAGAICVSVASDRERLVEPREVTVNEAGAW